MKAPSNIARRIISLLSVWSNRVAALALALMVIHISIDVMMRYFFSAPLTGTIEVVSAYYMVAVVAFPLAYVHLNDQHIRVELFTSGMSPATQKKIDTLVEVLLVIVFAVVAYVGFEEAISRTIANEVWEAGEGLIPVWPARWYLPIGFFLMACVGLVRVVVGLSGSNVEGGKSND
jgi:TRAP-type C4-dicarboxylate transport system permease small subunit